MLEDYKGKKASGYFEAYRPKSQSQNLAEVQSYLRRLVGSNAQPLQVPLSAQIPYTEDESQPAQSEQHSQFPPIIATFQNCLAPGSSN